MRGGVEWRGVWPLGVEWCGVECDIAMRWVRNLREAFPSRLESTSDYKQIIISIIYLITYLYIYY